MKQPTSTPAFDSYALLVKCGAWLNRIAEPACPEEHGLEAVAKIAGIQREMYDLPIDTYFALPAPTSEIALTFGYTFGIAIAAAVASEAYGGDVEGAIRSAIEKMRSDIEEVRREFAQARATPSTVSSATEMPPESPVIATASSEMASASSGALEQADAIARSASGTTIDWAREPLTERERKIRRAMLERILDTSVLPRLRIEGLISYDDRHHGAQDWRAALAEAKALEERERTERDREQLEDAIAAVDENEEGVA